MCGIAGYVGERELEPERLDRCLALMRRRGPDAAAAKHWRTPARRQIYLLHARLGIIDLDARANQPFRAGSKWLACNGELYNYVELRRELRDAGVVFTTESDTEVLLRVIERFGWAGLDRCEGMWAFAVYDEADGSLALCRDRFGEKPLYLYRDVAGGLYFGSEVKFLQALAGRRFAVNTTQIYRYLVNGYKSLYKTGETFFENVAELPQAGLLQVDAEGREQRTIYWEPRFHPEEGMTFEEAVAGVRERLIRAVELRLRADVPLAFCMSGGIDSTTLISIAKRVFGYDVHGFTVVNTDGRYQEQGMVESAVAELGIRHTAIPLQQDLRVAALRTLIRQHDAPVYTLSYVAHWMLMQSIAAHGYRVSVSGTGADELLSGYYDHHLAYLYEVRHDPALYAVSREAWTQCVRPYVRNPYLQDPDRFVQDPGFREHIFLDARKFASYLTDGRFEPFAERRFTDSLLRNRMLNEMFHEAVPVILHEDDLNAMYFSIENRSPYLDRRLFEFCYRIPSRHLVRDGRAKAVLRQAMRGIAPARILDNPRKVGFNLPIASLLDLRQPGVRDAFLEPGAIFEHVRRDRIAALLDKPELPNSESKFLFYFLNSKLFLEECA